MRNSSDQRRNLPASWRTKISQTVQAKEEEWYSGISEKASYRLSWRASGWEKIGLVME